MLDKYIALNRVLRNISAAAREAADAEHFDTGGFGSGVAHSMLSRSISDLVHLWPADVDKSLLDELTGRLKKVDFSAYLDISASILPRIEDAIDTHFSSQPIGEISSSILDLLHPRITLSSYGHFRSGRYRDAILNAIISVFDMIRERTGLDEDGADLVADAFSLQRPLLIFSDLETESGRNEQKGFIQILQGAYLGVRNPKAHTLQSNADQTSCAQYLVFASLLCRRIEECKTAK
jgi:uncharacterized protein (TIGR02391 family)